MFNGGTLLCLIFAIGVVFAMYWPEIRSALILDAPETHPDTLSSGDLRSRGFDPVDGVLEYEQHRARMRARQERLGYAGTDCRQCEAFDKWRAEQEALGYKR